MVPVPHVLLVRCSELVSRRPCPGSGVRGVPRRERPGLQHPALGLAAPGAVLLAPEASRAVRGEGLGGARARSSRLEHWECGGDVPGENGWPSHALLATLGVTNRVPVLASDSLH